MRRPDPSPSGAMPTTFDAVTRLARPRSMIWIFMMLVLLFERRNGATSPEKRRSERYTSYIRNISGARWWLSIASTIADA